MKYNSKSVKAYLSKDLKTLRFNKKDPVLAVLRSIEMGMYYEEASLVAGINPDTFYEWMRSKSEFSEAVERANAEAQSWHITNIREKAQENRNGGDLSLKFLERRWASKYKERNETELKTRLFDPQEVRRIQEELERLKEEG